jgi:hypothetical protein
VYIYDIYISCAYAIFVLYIYIYHISHTPYIDIHIPLFPLIIRAMGFDPTVSSEFQLARSRSSLCGGLGIWRGIDRWHMYVLIYIYTYIYIHTHIYICIRYIDIDTMYDHHHTYIYMYIYISNVNINTSICMHRWSYI